MAVTSTSVRFSSGLLSSLRRITSGSQYLPEIDGLRFIAITSVLLYHVGRLTEIHIHPYVVPAGRLAASLTAFVFNGYRGVPVFFAISGFIVALPFARRELQGAADTPLATYFRRRLTRIAPPYVISQLIRLYPVMIAKQLTLLQILPHLAAGLLYLHLALYRTAPIVQIVGWSLEIEVQFYIVAPFLVRFIFRIPAPWRRMLLVGAIAVDGILMHLASTVLPADPNSTSVLGTLVNFTLVYWIRYFLAGILMTDAWLTYLPSVRKHRLWDALGIVCWVALFLVRNPGMELFGALLIIGAFFSTLKGTLLSRAARIPLVTAVGGMCYSIYLTHSLILQGLYVVYMKVAPDSRGFYSRLDGAIILFIPCLVAFGAVFFVLVERPCMDKHWPSRMAASIRSLLGASSEASA